jgi:hypothetical protein
MDLYLLDNDFNLKIKNWQNLKQSGSRLWIWEMII